MNIRTTAILPWEFTIPSIYRAMFATGLLESSHDKYLLLSDIEWFSPERIMDSYPVASPNWLLVPFASSASGDQWSWRIDRGLQDDSPVLMSMNPMDEAVLFAPHFAGCVYRLLLEDMLSSRLSPGTIKTSGALAELYQRHAENLLPFIPFSWSDTIWRIACRPIITSDDGQYSFLTSGEARHILNRDLDLPFRGRNSREVAGRERGYSMQVCSA